jgi:FKBP-type peptidyl-prolyl cis-trans isomerase SlyD
MNVSERKVVSLTYELRKDSQNGEVVEVVTADSPLTFIAGLGNLLPKFEEQLNGLNVGDRFGFLLTAVDAYGEKNDQAIVDVPLDVFMIDGALDEELVQLGNTIPMRDQEGRRLNGIVTEVNDSTVKMDFNHPLAGDALYFSGSVTDVREATEEELTHGHVHGAGHDHHDDESGCGDEGCGSCGCGGSCN